jgi:hypothetical protein
MEIECLRSDCGRPARHIVPDISKWVLAAVLVVLVFLKVEVWSELPATTRAAGIAEGLAALALHTRNWRLACWTSCLIPLAGLTRDAIFGITSCGCLGNAEGNPLLRISIGCLMVSLASILLWSGNPGQQLRTPSCQLRSPAADQSERVDV